jgi:hypothetical protein
MTELTLRKLIHDYTHDRVSPYRKLRHATRKGADRLLARIDNDHGSETVRSIRYKTVQEWHADWSADGTKLPMGHALIGTLRTIINFGVVFLEDDECARVSVVLRKCKFSQGDARSEALTWQQADLIREQAHREGCPSIALAQAFQFEGTFRQKDIVGEWVPLEEPGMSAITSAQLGKWMRGLDWNEINADLVLSHVTSKKLKRVNVDLKLAPMVIEELERKYCDFGEKLVEYDEKRNVVAIHRHRLPASGPIIIDEKAGRPYVAHKFRRRWRDLARACGIPDNVQNRDTRAGAITEATNSGADLESVRHAAAHSNASMTARYSRDAERKTADVMKSRVAARARAVPSSEVA